jgi:protein-S-isoprenylcysteine O-methyltransferase Ste14
MARPAKHGGALTLRSALLGGVIVLHFSRLSLGMAAGVMTAAAGMVLVGDPCLHAAIVIAIGTLAGYWFDDLIDLFRDEMLHPILQGMRTSRAVLLASALLAISAFAIRDLPHEPREFQILIAFLCLTTALYCLRRFLASWARLEATLGPVKALGWSAACIFSPQLAAREPLTPRTWMALIFFFLLMLTVVDLWRHPTPVTKIRAAGQAVFCLLAVAMVLSGVALRWFSWWNYALLPAAFANILLVWIRQCSQFPVAALFSETVVFLNTLCGAVVIGAYSSGLRLAQARPVSLADWLLLAAAIVVGCIVTGNFLRIQWRMSQPTTGDGISSAVIALGLATYVFQATQCALHLQPWLLPMLNTKMFDSPPIQLAGAVIVAASLVLLAISYAEIGASWRLGIDSRAPGALVTTGVFRFSRNPIYLAADSFVAGSFLLNPTTSGLLFAILTPLYLHFQVRREEQFLAGVFGSEFGRYAARTRRYFSLPVSAERDRSE